jgi:hypothetical protein
MLLLNSPDNLCHRESHNIAGFSPLSLGRSIAPLPKREISHAQSTTRSPQPSDAVLSCLHRDDPLRHTYLRRRWQAQ